MKIQTLTVVAALLIVGTLATAVAQKADKDWTEWSKKDAQKILDDSPWSQTQTDTDTSQMFYSPTQDPQRMGTSSNDSSRLAQGATNQSVNVKYTVRFFSARPVREALVRLMLLAQQPSPEVLARLKNFAEVKDDQSIIVTVLYSSNDQRYQNTVMQAFNSAVTGTLKNNAYLERPDGKRLFLEEYVPPGKDGFGARFIFLRNLEEKPFLDANIREVRFHAEYPSTSIKIDRRFKVADMMYQGELEY
jgi:hypothetical protein